MLLNVLYIMTINSINFLTDPSTPSFFLSSTRVSSEETFINIYLEVSDCELIHELQNVLFTGSKFTEFKVILLFRSKFKH